MTFNTHSAFVNELRDAENVLRGDFETLNSCLDHPNARLHPENFNFIFNKLREKSFRLYKLIYAILFFGLYMPA